jgi:hypothetical protein
MKRSVAESPSDEWSSDGDGNFVVRLTTPYPDFFLRPPGGISRGWVFSACAVSEAESPPLTKAVVAFM